MIPMLVFAMNSTYIRLEYGVLFQRPLALLALF